jgi:hypothetical protein
MASGQGEAPDGWLEPEEARRTSEKRRWPSRHGGMMPADWGVMTSCGGLRRRARATNGWTRSMGCRWTATDGCWVARWMSHRGHGRQAYGVRVCRQRSPQW